MTLSVTTNAATGITERVATLNGEAAGILAVSGEVYFEYGKTILYGTTTTPEALISDDSFFTVLSLEQSETYHYRSMMHLSGELYSGEDSSFSMKTNGCIGFPLNAGSHECVMGVGAAMGPAMGLGVDSVISGTRQASFAGPVSVGAAGTMAVLSCPMVLEDTKTSMVLSAPGVLAPLRYKVVLH